MSVDIFSATDGVHGREIWETDGTAAGTVELADINPGSGDSYPTNLTTVGSLVYFEAYDGVGYELWRTNGYTAGTFAVTDPTNGSFPNSLTAVDGKLFFLGGAGGEPQGLFVTDGTVAGTQNLTANSSVANLTAMGGKLYFTQYDSTHGVELWSSDGTVGGTKMVADINPGAASSLPSNLTVFNGKLYFSAADATDGQELWSSDGTAAGTAMVADLNPGSWGSSPSNFVIAGSEMFFQASGPSGIELWATNGTAAGTVQLTTGQSATNAFTEQDVAGSKLFFENYLPGTYSYALFVTDGTQAGTIELAAFNDVSQVAAIGSNVVFKASDLSRFSTGYFGVYVSDGAAAGTKLVAEGQITGNEVRLGGKLYFAFTPYGGSNQLWTSDGTVSGTHLVESFDGDIGNLSVLNGALLFTLRSGPYDDELWTSDGTPTGGHEVREINPPEPGDFQLVSAAGAYGVIGSKLVFEAAVNGQTATLYVTDGSLTGTSTLANPLTSQLIQSTRDYNAIGGRLVFVGNDFADGSQIWSTRGVAGDAVMVTGPSNGFSPYTAPENVIVYNGAVYFTDTSSNGGYGLYVTDGTVAGTHFVTSLLVNAPPVLLGGKMLFLGSELGIGEGLLASDGTSSGTSLVSGLLGELSNGGVATNLTVSSGKAFFTVDTNIAGTSTDQLWVTDGTSGGTQVVASLRFSSQYQAISGLTAFDGGVVFAGADNAHGSQVWFSDGTVAGSYVLPINQTSDPSASLTWKTSIDGVPSGAVMLGGKAYFAADDGVHGAELWSSDGTAAGTAMVADLVVGPDGVAPLDLTVFNGKLLFASGAGGFWSSDGTAAGTIELSSTVSEVSDPVVLDGRAYFYGMVGGLTPTLFATDGTLAGTVTLASDVSSYPIAAGHTVYWKGGVGHGWGLYGYNTVSHTTTLLSSVTLGSTGVGGLDYAALGSKLIFIGVDDASGVQLWTSDGTEAGTFALTSQTIDYRHYDPTEFTICNGEMYFVVSRNDYPGVPSLWVTDGTVSGTKLVTSPSNPALLDISDLAAVGTKLYFVETPLTGDPVLMVYDTVAQSISNIQSLPDSRNFGSLADEAVVNNALFYAAADPNSGLFELFHLGADGTPLMLLQTASSQEQPLQLTPVGAKVFFYATDSAHGAGLFVSDGTVAGTIFLTAMPGVPNSLSFSAIGSKFYFENYDATNGYELWVSDGTVAGTHRVTDTETPNSANPTNFTVSGAKVYFSATDGAHGRELWSFNGSPGGAHLVADLNVGAGDSNPTNLTALGGKLYFEATNTAGKVELWRSDGTTNGTVALTTANNGENAQDLTLIGAKLFFFGSDAVHGSGLFVSDGTAGGTTFLAAFPATAFSATLSDANGELYFNGYDAAHNLQLWKSDGTVAGTVRVTDSVVNQGSYPQDLTPLTLTTPGGDFIAAGQADMLWRGANGDLSFVSLSGGAGAVTTQDIGVVPTDWTVQQSGDFNGDGKADLLWRNAGGDTAVWLANGGAGYTGFTPHEIGVIPKDWTIQQVGDFNGDGRADILWRNAGGDTAIWLANVGTGHAGFTPQEIGVVPTGWSIQQVGDFNGDGKADILWRNTLGDTAVWLSNAGAGYTGFTPNELGVVPTDWTVVQVGDFNGDGKADILWREAAGDTAIWLSKAGAGYAGVTPTDLGVVPTGWTVQQVGDFNGDGRADILWRTTSGDLDLWSSGSGQTSASFSSQGLGAAPTGSVIHPNSDITGDGRADLVWRNATGDLSIWTANSDATFTPHDIGVVPTDWSVQQLGDFSGDGKADILWRNAGGDTAIWTSNGDLSFTPHEIGVIPTGWTIQPLGDFNGDGKADILWRNTGGDTAVWLSNPGAGYAGFTPKDLGVVPTGWTIQQTGDFNGDGKADILWRDSVGDTSVWLSTPGAGYTGLAPKDLGAVPTSWTIQQVGDFNGDGKADILWLNTGGDVSLWLSNAGPGFNGFTPHDLGLAPAGSSIQQVGDFNGDGLADIVWRNATTGDVTLWQSNPTGGLGAFTHHDLGVLTADWHIL